MKYLLNTTGHIKEHLKWNLFMSSQAYILSLTKKIIRKVLKWSCENIKV